MPAGAGAGESAGEPTASLARQRVSEVGKTGSNVRRTRITRPSGDRRAQPFLGVIPARGGSKRIPGKNLAMLGGKPLLLHTVRAALAASRIGRVIVSTDDAAIARVALEAGAEVPSLRPADLARDESPMLGAIHHALAVAEAGGRWVEVVVLLQPTSPFRTNRHIDEAIGVYEASRADTVTAVRAAAEHPYYAWKRDGDHLVPFFAMQHEQTVRQELPEALVETGAIFVLRRGVIDAGAFYGDRIVPYEMDDLSSIDIDTPQDLAFAEFLLARNPGTGNS